jgi:hypothetical protein
VTTTSEGLTGPADPAIVRPVLQAARAALDVPAVYVGYLSTTHVTYAQVDGDWPGLVPGTSVPRSSSLCGRMLAGASGMAGDLSSHPAYGDLPADGHLGAQAYFGTALRSADGSPFATLAALDRSPRADVAEAALAVFLSLAALLEGHLATTGQVTVRRTAAGWVVEGPGAPTGTEAAVDTLTEGMSLADLLTADLTPPERPRQRAESDNDDTSRLKTVVEQLEHALAARVVVEQAIGVLAERHQLPMREAFERLRRGARARGRRVHEIARQVVDSTTQQQSAPRAVDVSPPRPRPAPGPASMRPRPGPPPRRTEGSDR